MNNMFHEMFGKVAPGMCRMSMDGEIAVKTGEGYKSYKLKKNRLMNCEHFVFDMGDEFFFVIPAKKVHPGDIILISGKPKCVIETCERNTIVINYEDATIETIVPEQHIFLGDTYFYRKIVSLFGNGTLKKQKGGNKILKYMMMKEMMKDRSGTSGINALLPFMVMKETGGVDLFGNIFDDEDEEEEV